MSSGPGAIVGGIRTRGDGIHPPPRRVDSATRRHGEWSSGVSQDRNSAPSLAGFWTADGGITEITCRELEDIDTLCSHADLVVDQ